MCQFFDDFGNYSGGSLRLRRLDNHGFEVAWRALICAFGPRCQSPTRTMFAELAFLTAFVNSLYCS